MSKLIDAIIKVLVIVAFGVVGFGAASGLYRAIKKTASHKTDFLVSYQFKQADGVSGFGSAVVSLSKLDRPSLPLIRAEIAPHITTNMSVNIVILNIVTLGK